MSQFEKTDALVLGGGIFGLYAAKILLSRGSTVTLIESDTDFFKRASFVNQARVHLGYHYPRSLGTALNSAECFEKFVADFRPAINQEFKKVYAIAERNSFTTAKQFEQFCEILGIPAEKLNEDKFFRKGTVEACYLTREYSFDARGLANILRTEIEKSPFFRVSFSDRVISSEQFNNEFDVRTEKGLRLRTPLVVNATYSGINGVMETFGFKALPLKYEIYEVGLGNVSKPYEEYGITVMDGPFFSVMPFGLSGFHSITAVEYSPQFTSNGTLPTFDCQSAKNGCTGKAIKNCDTCLDRPQSAFPMMYQLAKKFMKEDFEFNFSKSHFASKTVFEASELDDSRPTCVRVVSKAPKFVTVLSGKVGTIFELEDILS